MDYFVCIDCKGMYFLNKKFVVSMKVFKKGKDSQLWGIEFIDYKEKHHEGVEFDSYDEAVEYIKE